MHGKEDEDLIRAAGSGEYSPEYNAFSKYQPGGESPWGNPQQGGGNNQFYQQQFANLLQGDQNFQAQQQQSQLAKAAAIRDRPESEPFDYDAMWAGRGVTPSQTVQGDGDNTYSWNRIPGITPGETTNRELVNLIGSVDGFTEEEMGHWSQLFKENPNQVDSLKWAQYTDPMEGIANTPSGLEGGWPDRFATLYNSAFNRADLTTPAGGGPTAAPGYALPVGAGE
jgi:hypothetical protein